MFSEHKQNYNSDSDSEDSESEPVPVVIDIGSFSWRAGFASDSKPCSILQAVVGRPKTQAVSFLVNDCVIMDQYAGNDAVNNLRSILRLKYPMQRGVCCNWNDMEFLLHHTFYNELRIAPEEHPILTTEHLRNPIANKERMTQILFETFNVPAIYMAYPGVLALHAYAKHTGLTVDIGDGVCEVTPVVDGYLLKHAVQKMYLGGKDITEYLLTLLNEYCIDDARYYSSAQSSVHLQMVTDLKHQMCSVAPRSTADFTMHFSSKNTNSDSKSDSKSDSDSDSDSESQTYVLPDGKEIVVHQSVRWQCMEILFQPKLIGKQMVGIQELIWNAIEKCAICNRRPLCENILLCGATTTVDGFDARLKSELQATVEEKRARTIKHNNTNMDFIFSKTPQQVMDYLFTGYVRELEKEIALRTKLAIYQQIPHHIKQMCTDYYYHSPSNRQKWVEPKLHRQWSAWIGGAILSSMDSFQEKWVTKEEYDEGGPPIVYRRAF